jgi:hypothetical protein
LRDLRPEVSAALAAVVDAATAKRPEERYADDREMVADLEDVLAIEASRAGVTSAEATTVLRTLPPRARRRVPFSVLYRRRLVPLAALRSHLGTAAPPGARPVLAHRDVLIHLCAQCASAYNPDAIGSSIAQNNQTAGLAIDGDPSTAWDTQQYFSGSLGKPGVGLYVDATPGTPASRLILDTVTPGFSATIYATNRSPNPTSFAASHWVPLATVHSVSAHQTFTLDRPTVRYTYYLVWITSLPPHEDYVSLNEVLLYS